MARRVCAGRPTPRRCIARLNDTVTKIFNDPPVKEKLATLGLVVGADDTRREWRR